MQKLQAERRRRLLEYQQRKRLEAANGLYYKFAAFYIYLSAFNTFGWETWGISVKSVTPTSFRISLLGA